MLQTQPPPPITSAPFREAPDLPGSRLRHGPSQFWGNRNRPRMSTGSSSAVDMQRRRPENARANGLANVAMFGCPDGTVHVRESRITATGGHHLTVSINNSPQGNGPSSRKRSSRPKRQGSKRLVQDENVPEISSSVVNRKLAGSSEKISQVATTEVNDQHVAGQMEARPSYEIYFKHLVCKGRGSPLWITQPSRNLSIEYRRTGTRIGDVGVITSQGDFLFFFNICLPADHPINSNNVPHNFEPLFIDTMKDVNAVPVFGPESYLSSAFVKKSKQEGPSSGLVFESSAAEGAILTMPVGSRSEDAVPRLKFQKYAARHAAEWYRYIIDERGYEVGNGDVRLVTGHDKTSAWGMATFSGSSNENKLYLSFQSRDTNRSSPAYSWEYSGMAEVRNGPDPRDVAELRQGDPSLEHTVFDNQCLFLRTINVKLQDNVWKDLSSALLADITEEKEPQNDWHGPRAAPKNNSQGTRSADHSTRSSRFESRVRGQHRRALAVVQYNIPFSRISPLVSVSRQQHALKGHPGDSLNNMLLKSHPDATIAITSDKDWMCVINEDDTSLPSEVELCRRIRSSFKVCTEGGVVYLEKKSQAKDNLCVPIESPSPLPMAIHETWNCHSAPSSPFSAHNLGNRGSRSPASPGVPYLYQRPEAPDCPSLVPPPMPQFGSVRSPLGPGLRNAKGEEPSNAPISKSSATEGRIRSDLEAIPYRLPLPSLSSFLPPPPPEPYPKSHYSIQSHRPPPPPDLYNRPHRPPPPPELYNRPHRPPPPPELYNRPHRPPPPPEPYPKSRYSSQSHYPPSPPVSQLLHQPYPKSHYSSQYPHPPPPPVSQLLHQQAVGRMTLVRGGVYYIDILTPYYTPPHTAGTPRPSSALPPSPSTARPGLVPPSTDEAYPTFTISTILPNFLFLGPELTAAEHVTELQELGVKRILNIAAECDDDQGLNLKETFDKYYKIPMRDTVEEENIARGVREVCEILDDARLHSAPTYVHCKAGKSRSVTAVMAYLIHANHWTLSKAYVFVLERRKGISPNIGFVSELMNFEEQELGGKSVGLQPTIASNPSLPGTGVGAADVSGAFPEAYSGRRGGHIRESLPPAIGLDAIGVDGCGPLSAGGIMDRVLGDSGQEMEIKDSSGRYRHARRAPVDETTLQSMRRVSKAGLESSSYA